MIRLKYLLSRAKPTRSAKDIRNDLSALKAEASALSERHGQHADALLRAISRLAAIRDDKLRLSAESRNISNAIPTL